MSAFRLSSEPPEALLARMLDGRDPYCRDAHARARKVVAISASASQLDRWSQTAASLLEASLGIRATSLFFDLSQRWSRRPIEDLLSIGSGVNRIGREAGRGATEAVLQALADNLAMLSRPCELSKVVGSLERLAKQAPESMSAVAIRLGRLLQSRDAAALEDWIAVGLRTRGNCAASRSAYFSLQDPLSLRILKEHSGADDFSRLEKRLKAGLNALWDKRPGFRRLDAALRVSLAGGLLGFPRHFSEAPGEAADGLFWAAMTHAGAHLRYSCGPFPVGTLKPLQVALISLIEDTRVELLAAEEMPGLARLWRRLHKAESTGPSTIPDLLARLARALIDPSYNDNHAWVVKGRKLFDEVRTRLDDPAACRRIGGLLGNDLGQMRLQFDARNYLVEPAYRDDNLGIWDFGSQPDAPTEEIELASESVRVEQREEAESSKTQESLEEAEPSAKSRGIVCDGGVVVATYPEWDHTGGRVRPEWVTVLEVEPETRPVRPSSLRNDGLIQDVARVARSSSIGRTKRLRRLIEGDSIDIDASIAAAVERRSGRLSDGRIFQRVERGYRDLAVLLLLDLSKSTCEVDRRGRSVLEVERQSAAIMAEAFEKVGDSLAIHGFNSDGREKVRYQRLKEFHQPFGVTEQSRLDALVGEYSTRLGAAIRHSGALLSAQRAFRRVLLILTDGEPSDVDVRDAGYLTEDARHAVSGVRRSGIDVLAFGLGAGPFQSLDRIAGRRRVLIVPRVDLLPIRMLQLYNELKK